MILETDDTNGIQAYDRLFDYFNVIMTSTFNDEGKKVQSNKVFPESPRMKRKPKQEASPLLLLPSSLNLDWAFDTLLPMLQEGELEIGLAESIVERAGELFKTEPLLVDLNFRESSEIQTVVVGDIHGQFNDLQLIFRKFGRPSQTLRYVFNGDIVDRGPRSVACWLFLCTLKLAAPDFLYITRGNHESKLISVFTSSFARECHKLYDANFFDLCHKTFDELPLSYILNESIFITHGGLPKDLCLNELRKMSKTSLDPARTDKTLMALLWNDPTPFPGYDSNSRGPNVFSFGPNITTKFLQKHKLSLLIRSHQHQHFGYAYEHSGKCLTIFSSPNYQNLGNPGAVALVDSEGNVKVEQFE